MMGWGSQGYGMGGFGWIAMILFWGLIIIGIFLVIKHLTSGRSVNPPPAESDPLQILKERYARGEIDTQEFEERKKMLEDGQ